MELVAHDHKDFDTGGNLTIEERSMRVTAVVPKNVTGAAVRNAIRHYQKNPDAERFDKVRIRYKTPSGKSTSTTLDLDHLDAAFTLKEVIEFNSDVESHQEKLSQTVMAEMRRLVRGLAP
jgi:hypothetical protein